MKNINVVFGMTKGDMVTSCLSSEKADSVIDGVFTLYGYGTFEDEVTNPETGAKENKIISALKLRSDEDEEILVASPSETLGSALCCIREIYGEEMQGLTVSLTYGKSNAGRKFLTMRVEE